jgi:5-oxopent-3-ene-1,2,5-tricarboxylate decarboxylase/2-hydroxyhepta-2,4-diene-1,7-dioate isomerase
MLQSLTMRRGRILINDKPVSVVVDAAGTVSTESGKTLASEELSWLAPLHAAVLGVALNYKEHVKELQSQFNAPPHNEPPKQPVLIVKPPNSITGHQCDVQVPDGVDAIQPGPSLAIVIGKTARRVKASDAFDYIGGYTVFNDFSLPETSYFRPPITSKCYDSFGPMGPYIVDAADVAEPGRLAVRTYINGDLEQEANTEDLVRAIPELIETLTHYMTFAAGFVIATGFPQGRVSAQAGDLVEVEVEGVGRLESNLVTEAEYYAGASQ